MKLSISKTKLAIAAIGLLGVSALAVAGRPYYIERIYFSDASKTRVVGEYSFTCRGSVYGTGQRTRHYTDIAKESC